MRTNITRMLAGVALLCLSALPVPAFASSDAEMLRMAREIPGFGGMFYDENGALTVLLQDITHAPDVHARLGLQARGQRIRIVPSTYDFQDLYRWRDELNTIMSEPGVVTLDIDERRNRVVVGVDPKSVSRESLATLDSVRAATSAPAQAVIVETVSPYYPVQHVQALTRPVPAGVQIHWDNFVCTVGFNAIRVNAIGFVTNSHCSTTRSVVTGTIYNQNVFPNRIGVETVDPPFFVGAPCPPSRVCRFSDTIFATYDANALQDFRRIAHPISPNNPPPYVVANPSLAFNAPINRWNIVATALFPVLNEELNKVGRTTGWSRGRVVATCVNVNVAGGVPANITMLCQDAVNAAVLGGDSGSPVFRASLIKTDTSATLIGILWGGNAAGTQFIMSAWENITLPSELGPLTVF